MWRWLRLNLTIRNAKCHVPSIPTGGLVPLLMQTPGLSLSPQAPSIDKEGQNKASDRALQQMEAWFQRGSPWHLVAISLGAVAVVGWADHVMPWEFNLTLAYAVIILCVSWLGGGKMGLLLATLAGVVAWRANIATNPYQTFVGLLLANLSRLAFFYCMAICIGAIRKRRELDGARIQMLEEMRILEQDIVSASEHEQQRIGQDLHDGLCQQLAAICCAAQMHAEDLQVTENPRAADAIEIEKALRQAILEARNMARGIFPLQVDSTGLFSALVDLAETTKRLTGVDIVVAGSADLIVDDPEVAMHLYRIAQEALANAVRHGGARQVVLSVVADRNILELRIDDNGRGIQFPGDQKPTGMGLRTMRYRARTLGGELAIEPRAGGGTSVYCKIKTTHEAPIKQHEHI